MIVNGVVGPAPSPNIPLTPFDPRPALVTPKLPAAPVDLNSQAERSLTGRAES